MKTKIINTKIKFDRQIPVSELVSGCVYSDIAFESIEDCYRPPTPLVFEFLEGNGSAYFSIPDEVNHNYLKDPDNGLIGFPKSFYVYAY